jgi:NTE family protein
LNKKVYANEGSFFFIGAQFVNGEEWTIPGSTAIERDTIKKFHNWGILKMELQTYFLDRGFLRFGFNLEAVYSIQPFLQNYTATILSAPVYQPIQESRTLFLDDFRAFQFVGTGLQSIFHFNRNLDLRFEGYMFQPISTVLADADNLPYYSSPLLHRRFIVSGNLVFHSPIGPASIALNYYPEQKQPLSLIFNFGYILFKRKALK